MTSEEQALIEDIKAFLAFEADVVARANVKNQGADDFAYRSVSDFVLKNGHAMVWADIPRHERFRRGEPKMCYRNAASILPMVDVDRFAYAEGYVLRSGLPLPIHHAWLTPITGAHAFAHAYDVTLRRGEGEVLAYYGVVFDWQFVLAKMTKREVWGSVIDDWMNRWPLLRGEEAVADVVLIPPR